jgi:hypothetical protein
VVTIPPESLFTTSEAAKVSLGTLRTVGLQITPEAKFAFNYFLHVTAAVKPIVRTHGGSGHSQVHADCFPVRNKFNIRENDNDVKVKLILAEHQVSGSSRATDCILGISRNIEGIFILPLVVERFTIPVSQSKIKVCRLKRGEQPND